MSTRRETVIIEALGRGFKGVRRDMTGLAAGMAAISFAAKKAVSGLQDSTDAYIQLKNQTKVYASNQENANFRMQQTIRIARKYGNSLNEVGQVLQRISLSQTTIGFSDNTAVQIVENLAAATKLSGATAQEAEGALRQFAQGLAANRLSGQELNSVLEQIPLVAALIAESMGVTTGELRQLGKEGQITSQVLIDALGSPIEKLDKLWKNYTFTLEQLGVMLRTDTTVAIGKFVDKSGLLKTFGEIIKKFVIQPVRDLVDALTEGGPRAVSAINGMTIGLGALAGVLTVGVIGATVSLIGLMGGPFAIAVAAAGAAAGALATALYVWRDSSVEVFGATVSLGDVIVGVKNLWMAFARTVFDIVTFIPRSILSAGRAILDNWDHITGGMTKVFRGALSGIIQGVEFLKIAFDNLTRFLKGETTDTIEQMFLNSRGRAKEAMDEMQKNTESVIDALIAKFKELADSGVESAKAIGRELAELLGAQYNEGSGLSIAAETTSASGPSVGKTAGVPIQKRDRTNLQQILNQYAPIEAVYAKAKEDQRILDQLAQKGLVTLQEYYTIQQLITQERGYQLDIARREFEQRQLERAGQDGVLTPEENLRSIVLGVDNAMARIKAQVTDLASVVEQGLVQSFNMVNDAITELATTGKANWKGFARSILNLIQQLITKLLVAIAMQTILNALSNGGATAGNTAVNTTVPNQSFDASAVAASGRPIHGGGGLPILVGERGPELFVPPSSGSIKNNTTTMGMMTPPPTQVTIINVDSMDNVLDALGSEEGEGAILNVIQRNRDVIRSAASGR